MGGNPLPSDLFLRTVFLTRVYPRSSISVHIVISSASSDLKYGDAIILLPPMLSLNSVEFSLFLKVSSVESIAVLTSSEFPSVGRLAGSKLLPNKHEKKSSIMLSFPASVKFSFVCHVKHMGF